uniref:Putative secreted protein n=1 Tax=Panstrongylus lignarius TaxID=156445 RepID=A0A224Y083_9HEMI
MYYLAILRTVRIYIHCGQIVWFSCSLAIRLDADHVQNLLPGTIYQCIQRAFISWPFLADCRRHFYNINYLNNNDEL